MEGGREGGREGGMEGEGGKEGRKEGWKEGEGWRQRGKEGLREGGRGREGEKEGREGGRRLQIALTEGVMFLTRDEVIDNCCFWSESERRPCLTATATYTHIIYHTQFQETVQRTI